jgi:IS1 family transposase
MDERLRGLTCRHLQLDEIWGYVGKHQRRMSASDNPRTMGDFWTFVAIDTDTRLIPAHRVGKRDAETCNAFLADLASRVTNRVLISSDALAAYVDAIDRAFGTNVDYGQIVKSYEAEPMGPGRYSPPRLQSQTITPRLGNPDCTQLSTTYVERSNFLMRMTIRRLTRLTDAYSKKVENLRSAIMVHMWHYNFARYHGSLRCTPAMAAGVANRISTWEEILG